MKVGLFSVSPYLAIWSGCGEGREPGLATAHRGASDFQNDNFTNRAAAVRAGYTKNKEQICNANNRNLPSITTRRYEMTTTT